MVEADWNPVSASAAVITPSLLAGGAAPALPHEPAERPDTAEVWVNVGTSAWMPAHDDDALRVVLSELAVPPGWIDHQLHYARTGRIRPVPEWPDAAHNILGCTS
jgi:hypothetical protein